ncbi:hypothetical protein [Cytobacillus purgationiresistens]|uniref:Uncharacterized protein n=1 Tax=Cytobacillus purgationiresistens TaxID=863449 RepID=A0ABU0AJE0_9BACI|nr:hypothetical protein [Cytobacillus purgationiresistens]MDQ0271367.1 hypothetical protein [Cytobacillus purgationiresistens]
MNWILPFGLTICAFWILYFSTQSLPVCLLGGVVAFTAGVIGSAFILKKRRENHE